VFLQKGFDVSIIRHPARIARIGRLLHVDSRTRSRIRHVSGTVPLCKPMFPARVRIQCDTRPDRFEGAARPAASFVAARTMKKACPFGTPVGAAIHRAYRVKARAA
jgi:hypothetical protein